MISISTIPADQILRECQTIQAFLEADYPADNPAACDTRGRDLETYMARTGKMLADAKHWRDQFVNSAIMAKVSNKKAHATPANIWRKI